MKIKHTPTGEKCGALTKAGKPCQRMRGEYEFCALHDPDADADDDEQGDGDIYGDGEYQISYDSAMYRN